MLYLTDTGRRWDGHKVSVRNRDPQSVLASAGGFANVEESGQGSEEQVSCAGSANTAGSGKASEEQ